MSEYEPDDSRVVHGNAAPKKGDKRFAQDHEQAEQASATSEDGLDQEHSRNNDPQFEASELDRGAAQYQREPLIQQQHQADDWSKHNDRGETQLQQPQQEAKQSPEPSPAQDAEFETGQADYGSAQAKAEDASDDVSSADDDGAQARQELVDHAAEGDLTDDDIEDAAPEQAQLDREDRDIND